MAPIDSFQQAVGDLVHPHGFERFAAYTALNALRRGRGGVDWRERGPSVLGRRRVLFVLSFSGQAFEFLDTLPDRQHHAREQTETTQDEQQDDAEMSLAT